MSCTMIHFVLNNTICLLLSSEFQDNGEACHSLESSSCQIIIYTNVYHILLIVLKDCMHLPVILKTCCCPGHWESQGLVIGNQTRAKGRQTVRKKDSHC